MLIKKLISFTALFVVLAFVLISGAFIISKLFLECKPEYKAGLIGALMGAFFAFLALRIGDALMRLYERKKRHYNSVVRFQHLCNYCLNIISDNILVITDFKELKDKAFSNNSPVISVGRLRALPLEEKILIDLANIYLINKGFFYRIGVDKMNYGIETLNRFYEEIKDAFVQNKIDYPTYKFNLNELVKKHNDLEKALIKLRKETLEISAILRILARDRPLLNYFIGMGPSAKKLEKAIIKETGIIEKEIAENERSQSGQPNPQSS